MGKIGCLKCHSKAVGNTWINLQNPERSRILRAPLAKSENGLGLGWCRDRKAQGPRYPLVTQAHQPPDVRKPKHYIAPDGAGDVIAPFAGTDAPGYQALLAIIRKWQREALKSPRVDMPGAIIVEGRCRELPPLVPPE